MSWRKTAILSTLLLSTLIYGQQRAAPLTNERVVEWVRAGWLPDEIARGIASAQVVDFNLAPAGENGLRAVGVKEETIRVMSARTAELAGSSAVKHSQAGISQTQGPIATQSEMMDNAALIKLAKAGLSEDVLLGLVNGQPGKYSLSPDSLIALKQASVSERVIAALVNKTSLAVVPSPVVAPSPVMRSPVPSEPVALHDGTPVRLRLTRNLSSGDAKTGDTVDFEVLEDVKVDDVLVVARGATAIATITKAEAKKRMARGGKLDINLDYVRLVNGDKIALRAIKETSGGGHTGAMTGAIVATSLVLWPAAPFFLFMHGKDTTIPKGTELTAYVVGEVRLERQKLLTKQ